VVGLDATGRTQTTVVAHLGAALWTGLATEFWFSASDGVVRLATVTRRDMEFAPRPTEES
jgi:hypothetical protein